MKIDTSKIKSFIQDKKTGMVGIITNVVGEKVELKVTGKDKLVHTIVLAVSTVSRYWTEITEDEYIALAGSSDKSNKEDKSMSDSKKAPAPKSSKPSTKEEKVVTPKAVKEPKVVKPAKEPKAPKVTKEAKAELTAEEKAAKAVEKQAKKAEQKAARLADKAKQKDHFEELVRERLDKILKYTKSKNCSYTEKSYYNSINFNGYGIAFVIVHSNSIELRFHPAAFENISNVEGQPNTVKPECVDLMKKLTRLAETYKTHMSLKFTVLNDDDVETAKELLKMAMLHRSTSKDITRALKASKKAESHESKERKAEEHKKALEQKAEKKAEKAAQKAAKLAEKAKKTEA